MVPIKTRLIRSEMAFAAGILALAASLLAGSVEAQEIHLFPCKIVCGYQRGNVRLLNDTSPLNQPYEDLKPGNYATTCNMFNYDLDATEQTVLPYVVVEGAPLIFLGPLSVPTLRSNAFGCIDLIAVTGPPVPPGIAFEGYLTFFTFDPDITFEAIYTYSSQNAFEHHVLWSYNPFGIFGIAFQTLGLALGTVGSPLPDDTEGVLSTQFAAASGAGGLGLGASIDVEDVERITIDLSTPGDPDKMPPEVRDVLDALGQTSEQPSG